MTRVEPVRAGTVGDGSSGAGKGHNRGSVQMICIVVFFVGRILQLFFPTFRGLDRDVHSRCFYFTTFLPPTYCSRTLKSD